MEDQGPYANITYPSIKAVKSRGLPAAGVIIEFCTFGDYNDTHKVRKECQIPKKELTELTLC